jgi:hypothetical protein
MGLGSYFLKEDKKPEVKNESTKKQSLSTKQKESEELKKRREEFWKKPVKEPIKKYVFDGCRYP